MMKGKGGGGGGSKPKGGDGSSGPQGGGGEGQPVPPPAAANPPEDGHNETAPGATDGDGRPAAPAGPGAAVPPPTPVPDPRRTPGALACEPAPGGSEAPAASSSTSATAPVLPPTILALRTLATTPLAATNRIEKAQAVLLAMDGLTPASDEAKRALTCLVHYANPRTPGQPPALSELEIAAFAQKLVGEKTVPINAIDSNPVPLIVRAAETGSAALVEALLAGLTTAEAKATFIKVTTNPANGENALMTAARLSKPEVVEKIIALTGKNFPLLQAKRTDGMSVFDIAGREWQSPSQLPVPADDLRKRVLAALLGALPEPATVESRALLNDPAPPAARLFTRLAGRATDANPEVRAATRELTRQYMARGGDLNAPPGGRHSGDNALYAAFRTEMTGGAARLAGIREVTRLTSEVANTDGPLIERASRRPATDTTGPKGTADHLGSVPENLVRWEAADLNLTEKTAVFNQSVNGFFGPPSNTIPIPATDNLGTRTTAVRAFCAIEANRTAARCVSFFAADSGVVNAENTMVPLPTGTTAAAARLLLGRRQVYLPADQAVEKAKLARNNLQAFLGNLTFPDTATETQVTEVKEFADVVRKTSTLAVVGAQMAQVLSNHVAGLAEAAFAPEKREELRAIAVEYQNLMLALANSVLPEPAPGGPLKRAFAAGNKVPAAKQAFNDFRATLNRLNDRLVTAGFAGTVVAPPLALEGAAPPTDPRPAPL